MTSKPFSSTFALSWLWVPSLVTPSLSLFLRKEGDQKGGVGDHCDSEKPGKCNQMEEKDERHGKEVKQGTRKGTEHTVSLMLLRRSPMPSTWY